MTAPPDLVTRLEFGHALAQWSADRAGARVLHIKGLAAHLALPLDAMGSMDVDVLVEPGQHGAMLEMLSTSRTTEVSDDGSFSSEAHAMEVVNNGLGVALDVHGHFPGFRAPPGDVFEVLWSRSGTVSLGGWRCPVPDHVGTALIGLAHAARNAPTERTHRDAVARWHLLDSEERDELRWLIERLDAHAAAHVVLGGYEDADRWEVALYRAHQQKAPPGRLWLLTFLAQPTLTRRWGVLQRAVNSRIAKVTSRG